MKDLKRLSDEILDVAHEATDALDRDEMDYFDRQINIIQELIEIIKENRS
jgi:hypothetical protein